MKKGQIEIFGLAFIVILVSIGFFIFLSFKSQEIPPTPRIDYTTDKIASDFILAIPEVNIEGCEEYTLEDLIVDCARDGRITCGIYDSCIALNKSIAIMLNKTFIKTNTAFRFYSENLEYKYNNYGQTGELLNFSNLNCNENSLQGKSGTRIISLYPMQSNVYLNMNICYR